MIEAKPDVQNCDFAADIASQHTPFILGETGYILVPCCLYHQSNESRQEFLV
jgi:hypothetical protein